MVSDNEIGYGARANATSTKDAPLTVEMRDAAQDNLQRANRIYSVLSDLRDRIHGSSPTAVGREVGRNEPGSFAATMRMLNGDLAEQLDSIERIVADFANRL